MRLSVIARAGAISDAPDAAGPFGNIEELRGECSTGGNVPGGISDLPMRDFPNITPFRNLWDRMR